MQNQQTIKATIVSILGVDESEVVPEAEFQLDLNATPEELAAIKVSLEEALDIVLPDFEPDAPATVEDLENLVNDATL